MTNGDAATGSEWQVLALPVVLQHVQRDLECLDLWTGWRKTGGQARDLTGHRHVSLEMGRRNRERIREVVKAPVRRLVPREQRLDVEVEREQVANGVVIFRAIETMDRAAPAWIRTGRPGAVDFVLERTRHGAVRGRIGTRPSGRRHRSGPKLLDHPLPDLWIGAWLRNVRTVERKSGGTELLIVARDAIRVQKRAGISPCGWGLSAQEGQGYDPTAKEREDSSIHWQFQFWPSRQMQYTPGHHAYSEEPIERRDSTP